MEQLDCRGLACPEPVIKTKKYLAGIECGGVKVLVDNEAAFQNVQKVGKSLGCSVEAQKEGDKLYAITIQKSEGCTIMADEEIGLVVMIASETLGTGDPALGKKLMQSYLYTLTEKDMPPKEILLLNGGVKNAVEGADCLKNLRILSDKGTDILVCGTCLDFYGLKEKLAVGRVSNMYEIEDVMSHSAKLVSLT